MPKVYNYNVKEFYNNECSFYKNTSTYIYYIITSNVFYL